MNQDIEPRNLHVYILIRVYVYDEDHNYIYVPDGELRLNENRQKFSVLCLEQFSPWLE